LVTDDNLSFQFGEFEIHPRQQELRRRGHVVHIEPQVFDLLLYLVSNRERTVSRDELIESVWGGRIISESALSSRISAARRALGDSGEQQRLIRTVSKRGFRFVGSVELGVPSQAQPADDGKSATLIPAGASPFEPAPDAALVRLALPDKPSIAVLPFQNISGDPEQEYFADGLAEDMITGLSRQRWFFVIARNSTFTYKGKPIDVRQVSRELGVRYVLEGSVRKAAGKVRVTGQLIDAANGVHLWADRYDRQMADVFAIQDDITNRVIDSVGSQIVAAEAARIRRKPPQSIDAWDLVIQALPHMWRANADEQRRAQDLLQQAIAIDPSYAHAHALLGWTHVSLFNLVVGRPLNEFVDQALDVGTRAVSLDGDEPWAHLVLGLGHSRRRRPERAVAHLSNAIDLNPSFALAYAGLGYALACSGEPERGLQSLEQALRLSPRDPFLAYYAPTVRYMALFALERYEDAVAVCRSTAELYPDHVGAWRLMTVSLGLLGKIDEARQALAHTRSLQPDLSLNHVEKNTVYASPADRARFLQGLRNAGLKD
jgi:TolB-like protein/DNA-binding winged helix-turn-helix (wHTH) protein/Tfp pilus assembly protein PilF